jgi:hypothetical protein
VGDEGVWRQGWRLERSEGEHGRPEHWRRQERRGKCAAIHARIPKPTEADEEAVRIDVARDDIAFWGKVRADSAPVNKTRRRLIETVERQLADQRALAQMAEEQITAAQAAS